MPYQYAVIQVVPDVERGERFNAGVVLFCRSRRFLSARTSLDLEKLSALAPACDSETITTQLEALERIAAGDISAGPLARLEQAERFHWLVAPGSTMLQPSDVHSGLTSDPAAALDRLFHRLVKRPK
ncbi:MAG: DUF3037 domain-containing protein [Chloroflexota bacterium]|nr:DUF3037 domain-containing protein [Chloroflexota bacterium]